MPIFTPHEAHSWKDIIGEEKASNLAVFDDSEPKCETFAEFKARAYAGFTPAALEPTLSARSSRERFFAFLEKHGCKNAWVSNFNPINDAPKDREVFFAAVPLHEFINSAFDWDNTLEDFDYWCDLHDAWTGELQND